MEKLLFVIIGIAVKAVSPTLRGILTGMFQQLSDAAAKTDNKWDDLLVEILGVLLGIKD